MVFRRQIPWYDLILTRRSQIFDYLRKTFCRRAVPAIGSFRKKDGGKKVVFLRKRLTIIDLFERLWSVGARFRR